MLGVTVMTTMIVYWVDIIQSSEKITLPASVSTIVLELVSYNTLYVGTLGLYMYLLIIINLLLICKK